MDGKAVEQDVGFIAMKPFGGGMLGNANLAIKYLLQFEGVLDIGHRALPQRWRDRVQHRDHLVWLADRLAAPTDAPESETPAVEDTQLDYLITLTNTGNATLSNVRLRKLA